MLTSNCQRSLAVIRSTGVILSASYALWLYRRVMFGDLIKESLRSISDMSPREIWIFAPLVAMTILLGIYPSLVLDVTGPSVAALVHQIEPVVSAARDATQLASQ